MENNEQLHLISILLQYPDQDMVDMSLEELAGVENQEVVTRLKNFHSYLQTTHLDVLTESYVRTFDFSEKTNLYLTYSKLKDERERGNILVKLKEIYRDEGFILDAEELPDYLPLLLEFISIAKSETVKSLVPQFIEPIEEIQLGLQNINSPYTGLLEASLIIFKEILDQ